MEPPSYEEANRSPQALDIPPPPSYDASLSTPPTPPPTYGEAVTNQQDPFPVLTPPRVPTAATPPSQNTGFTVHPLTQIGVAPSFSGIQAQPGVIVTQPPPVPITVTCLGDVPGVVRCLHCHHVVTTNVTYVPGMTAWCMCICITLMGLICGFCLIPLMIRGLQDAHHSCPRCKNHLHTYMR